MAVRRVLGIGLVALDVVIDEDAGERLGATAGGSCGNVMAILAWLGWDAAPVARLGDDPNADLVRRDLRRHKVDDRWLSLSPAAPTPIYIERLKRGSDGTATHKFDRFCATCGGRLPRYQAVPGSALGPVLDDLASWDILYIDRPSAGSVRLAQAARAAGKLVVFEPSARGAPRHMRALASQAQVVKYSSERLTATDRKIIEDGAPTLEIETRGAAGLAYRTGSGWKVLDPPRVKARDTAGAGDWTTAGLLHGLATLDVQLPRLKGRQLRELLASAQALGSWSCRFDGPRGAMEHHSPRQALEAADALRRGDRHTTRRRPLVSPSDTEWACTGCR